MKKKVATAAIAAMTMTFLAGCSSRGTYAKYLTLGEYKGLDNDRRQQQHKGD